MGGLPGDPGRVGVRTAGEVQAGQREERLLVVTAAAQQPLRIVEAALRYPQLGERRTYLAFAVRTAVGRACRGQPEGHLGFAPAADVAQDPAEFGSAVRV